MGIKIWKLYPRRVIIRERIHLANGWACFQGRGVDVVTDSKFSGNEQQNV